VTSPKRLAATSGDGASDACSSSARRSPTGNTDSSRTAPEKWRVSTALRARSGLIIARTPTDLLHGSSVCAGAEAGASVGSTIQPPTGQHPPVNPHAAASRLLKRIFPVGDENRRGYRELAATARHTVRTP
jgi:hypothetical protein